MKYLLLILTACSTLQTPSYKWNPKVAVAAFTYSWFHSDYKSELAEIAKVADELKISHEKIGVTIEAQGWDPVTDWKADLHAHYAKLPDLLQEVAKHGMWAHVVVYNSNTSGKGYKWRSAPPDANAYIQSETKALIAELKKRDLIKYGIFNFMSEDDASTPANIRDGMRALGRSLVESSHLMSEKPGNGWVDHHPAHLSTTPKAGSNDIITSDNGPIISEIFSNLAPKLPACIDFRKRSGTAGITSYYFVDSHSAFKINRNAWKECLSKIEI